MTWFLAYEVMTKIEMGAQRVELCHIILLQLYLILFVLGSIQFSWQCPLFLLSCPPLQELLFLCFLHFRERRTSIPLGDSDFKLPVLLFLAKFVTRKIWWIILFLFSLTPHFPNSPTQVFHICIYFIVAVKLFVFLCFYIICGCLDPSTRLPETFAFLLECARLSPDKDTALSGFMELQQLEPIVPSHTLVQQNSNTIVLKDNFTSSFHLQSFRTKPDFNFLRQILRNYIFVEDAIDYIFKYEGSAVLSSTFHQISIPSDDSIDCGMVVRFFECRPPINRYRLFGLGTKVTIKTYQCVYLEQKQNVLYDLNQNEEKGFGVESTEEWIDYLLRSREDYDKIQMMI